MKIQVNGTDITPILNATEEILEFIGSPPTGGLSDQIEELDAHLLIVNVGVGAVGDAVNAVKDDTEDILEALGPTGPVMDAIAAVKADTEEILSDADTARIEASILETHFHSPRRYLCRAVTPNAEIHIADQMSLVVSPNTATGFLITAGNNTWGAWIQMLGSADTPVIAGKLTFDINEFYATDFSNANTPFLVQIGFGTSGASALAAGIYSEFMVASTNAINASPRPLVFNSLRIAAGTKVWARVLSPGFNARTITFFFGLHEYGPITD